MKLDENPISICEVATRNEVEADQADAVTYTNPLRDCDDLYHCSYAVSRANVETDILQG